MEDLYSPGGRNSKQLIVECIKMLSAVQKNGARSGRRGIPEGRAAFEKGGWVRNDTEQTL